MMRRLLTRFVPAHFNNPFRLAVRVARSGGPGRFAIFSAGMGLVATPLDILLKPFERRIYQRAAEPAQPLIFVCGPPRSGTSIVAATLLRSLPVAYVNNLMAVFPRAPLLASRLAGVGKENTAVQFRTFYGRTKGFRAQNDGLFLWDRWVGQDRKVLEPNLDEQTGQEMRRFWAAFEQQCRRPILAKNNNLNCYAKIIAKHLPTAHFLCLQRDPLFLAQSLLIAREEIHGDTSTPYGQHECRGPVADPIEDVCRQVRFLERAAADQLHALGPDRFWLVSYEQFCEEPSSVVADVAERILQIRVDRRKLARELPTFVASTKRRLPEEILARIAATLSGGGESIVAEAGGDGIARTE